MMSFIFRLAAAVCLLAATAPAQTSAEDFRQKGLALFRDQKFADALKAFERSLQLDPANPKTYVGRAICRRRLGRKEEALEDYNRAIQLDPAYSNAYMNRAGLHYENGDLQAALADYNRSIELDPKNAPALYSRGLLNTKLNNPAAARADFERSLQADPNNAYAPSAKAELARLPAAAAAPAPQQQAQQPPPQPQPPAAPSQPAYSSTVDKLAIPHAAFNNWPFPTRPAALPPLPEPPPGPPAYLPENLDINHLGPAAYDANLRAARESVHLIRGPMSPQEEEQFELAWAPLFEYPCQPVIEYFNRLTPLLNRFSETRAALQRALAHFNNTYEEAITAAGLGDEDAVREAMDVAGVHRNSIAALDIRLNAIARDIDALGDPPDPLSHRRRARALNEEAARFVKGKPAGGTYWVLTNAKADNGPKASDDKIKFTHIVSEGYAKGSVHESYIQYGESSPRRRSAVGELRWTPPPPVLPASKKSRDFDYSMDVRLTCSEVQNYGANDNKDDCARIFLDPSATTNNFARLTPIQPSFSGAIAINQFPNSTTFKLKLEIATPGGYTQFWYTYELRDLTPEQVAEIKARAAQNADARSQSQAGAAARSAELLNEIYDAQTQQEAKLQAIAFAKENQKYFEAKRDEYRNAANASPADRDRYQYLAMVMDANLQAEKDNQATMETGQWTRTRTEYDDWNFQFMAAQSQAAARDYQQRAEANAAIPRILALFPKELRDVERSAAYRAVGEAIARGDTAGVRKAAADLAARSQQYWAKQGQMQQQFADNADVALTYANGVKNTAAFAAAAVTVPAGPAYFIGYMGVTGAIEGGLEGGLKGAIHGGVRGAVSAVHPAAMVALSAYDGYSQGGAEGALKNAATSAAFILGAQKVVGPIIGRVLSPRKAPPVAKSPTVEQLIAEARFQSRMANGRAKVKLFKERAQLAQLARGADPKTLADLEAKAAEAAKAIKCDYAAKMALNQAGRAEPALVKAYLQRDQMLMAQVEKELQQGLAREGYGPVELRRFSNSATDGKAGIDVDIGIVEPPRIIRSPTGQPMRNPVWDKWRQTNLTRTTAAGTQRVSLHNVQQAGQQQLQKAFDKVYGGPGRPTQEGFVNFTTSAHAEAYVDVSWIGRRGLPHADFESIQPGSAQQAGDVTAFKLSHAIPAAKSPDYLKLQEGCRTLVKDFNTKLIGSATSTVNPQAPLAKATPDVQRQILKLRATMDAFAKNEIGPIEADRAIRELTGGEGLPAAVRKYQSLLVAGSK